MQLKRFLPVRQARIPRLDLELLHAGSRQRRIGILVLTLAVILALGVTVNTLQASRKIAQITADDTLDHPVTVGQEHDAATDEETKVVQNGIDHLALPWGRLFSAIESATADHINLVEVAPNAEAGTIQIIAEATDVYEMLEYVRALTGQPALKGVTLAAYEVGNSPDQPVRFTLTAEWGKRS